MNNRNRKGAFLLLLIAWLVGCAAPSARYQHNARIIVLWHNFTGVEGQALQTMGDRFNDEHSDIVLIVEYQEEIQQKLTTTASDYHPDLLVIWPEDLVSYRRAGVAIPRQPVPRDVREAGEELLPMGAALYTFDGELQALPLGLATYLTYYNADWLGDLAYDASQAGWEDLRRAACAATDPLGGQVGLGMPAQAGVLLAILTAGGANIIGDDDLHHFADPAGLSTVMILNEILSGGCGSLYVRKNEGVDQISNSALAMTIESSTKLKAIEEAVAKGSNFFLEVAPIPGESSPGRTLWFGPGLLLVAPQGERREAAFDVMAWFFSPEAQVIWSDATHYLPVRRSLLVERANSDRSVREQALTRIALDAAIEGTWVAWPPHVNTVSCRSALLRSLMALDEETLPGAHLDTAATVCNTQVNPVQSLDAPVVPEATP